MFAVKKAFYRIYQSGFKLIMGTSLFDWSEPELLEGAGAVRKLPAFIAGKGLKKPLIITDKGLTSLHLLDGMLEEFGKIGLDYVLFDGVQPNPNIENIEEARDLYIKNNCDSIVAFGGGSPMDCAKAAGARISNPNKSVDQMRGLLHVTHKIPPLFAVPTTSGTGSEITIAAVVTNEQTHEKGPINDFKLKPRYAVLDPELTMNLPPHITATTGMDALTHAVEAYIGRSNVANTEDYAEKAVKLIFDNIETVYADGKNLEARANMMKAAYYAGAAFTRAYVGYVHSIGHNLGGLYHVPHGLAMAVILPHVLDYYGETAYARLAKLAVVSGVKTDGTDEEKAKAFIAAIRKLNENMNIPTQIEAIKEKDIPILVKRALKEANPLYPVPKIMDEKDCAKVVRGLMA